MAKATLKLNFKSKFVMIFFSLELHPVVGPGVRIFFPVSLLEYQFFLANGDTLSTQPLHSVPVHKVP